MDVGEVLEQPGDVRGRVAGEGRPVQRAGGGRGRAVCGVMPGLRWGAQG
ncbi:hypothetical protein KCH_24690 [Kitasatospora cheerisanensis KCTC 2395]|uniref:Uncharacterized protein n=1 Tax=Kitasatospora cheerisanensis KCTC 2395 TaxID=1348663 RepID=A0A066Z644_9ACTN|nr:hypothetical protein KCH_24690 [Kitasatospora cheerisanensis KCTC 2395]